MVRVFWELCERAYTPPEETETGIDSGVEMDAGRVKVLSAGEAALRRAGERSDMKVVTY